MYQIFTETTTFANSNGVVERDNKGHVSSKKDKNKVNFKPMLAILYSLFCIINFSFAEEVVATYSLSYFNNKQYDIEASEIKDGKFSIYIQVSAESESTRAMLSVKSTDLEEFVQFLLQMKAKYVEWSEVAKANNVTDMSKKMDCISPSTTICWNGSKWYFSFGHKLQPSFSILESGEMVASIVEDATASSNEYIEEKIYWAFSNAKEIDDLVAQLDAKKITEKLQEKQNADDLFK